MTSEFAVVWKVQGDVTAALPEGAAPRKLGVGDAVFVKEQVRAGAGAEAVLRTADAGLIAVRPGAAFVAESFVADGQKADRATFRILTGGLRIITGWIGQLNKREYRVVTATATIGIRGTDHETYVIDDNLAEALNAPVGTYDKVNRGATTIELRGNKLDVTPGRVGFARGGKVVTNRALMTLVLPVLLKTVPGFYVPGQFDTELDALSATAAQANRRALQKRQMPQCDAANLARQWLEQLDSAIARQDAPSVMQLFSADVIVKAAVRSAGANRVNLDLSRNEFAQSAMLALQSLTHYKQRRADTFAQPVVSGNCAQIKVTSLSIEQGQQNAKPFRFEAFEEFILEQQQGQWVAVGASTVQR